jgi:SecD/SecF fusion protein
MKKTIVTFGLILLFTAILAFSIFFGLDLGIVNIPSIDQGITLGLDLVGGSEITYEAVVPEGMSASELENSMKSVQTMMRQRLNNLNFTEANVYLSGSNRVIVEIPNVTDPEEAVQMLGTTAVVEFRDYQGNVILGGEQIESAVAAYLPVGTGDTYQYCVTLKLNEEGRQRFKEGTKLVAALPNEDDRYVSIVMDDNIISSPKVSSEYAETGIDTDEPLIELGDSSSDYANYLAGIISSGALPFELKDTKLESVGASLGEESLRTAIIAGLIGLVLVMIYMVVVYRIPGLVADVALLVYVVMFMVIMSAMQLNLSLPGIAGIILTIGMAVDANVVIYERLREELNSGKTLRSAVDAGFKRALTAILDSNITTLIAGFVLLWQGTGTILGFAKTLLIGVVLSMICMLIIPRMLLRSFANTRKYKPVSYGLPKNKKIGSELYKNRRFVSRLKITGTISILLVATAIVALILLPFGISLFNLDIDFVGGTHMQFELGRPVTQAVTTEVEGLIKDATGIKPSSVIKSGNEGTSVSIDIAELSTEQREAVFDKLCEVYGTDKVELLSSDFVSASVGSDITRSAFIASIAAVLLILVYITVRFELRSGLAAIISLVHDILVMLSLYVIFQINLNMNFIAAALTILGYSINATIVVFDRIRENIKKTGGAGSFETIVDASINQTMRRSIGTTITTLIPIIFLLIMGVSSIRNFAFPIMAGVLAGCYSSVCISGPIWNKLKGSKTVKIKG